jgi:lipopolysaccharide/colanic/teichoic acid biosynthesis glycosyltransferase
MITHMPTASEKVTIEAKVEKNLKDNGIATNGSHNVSDKECQEMKDLIIKEVGIEVFNFLRSHLSLKKDITFVTSTSTRFNIEKVEKQKHSNIINLKRINDIRWVNKFFETVNSKLDVGDYYVNSVETYVTRRHRFLKRFMWPFNYLIYSADVFVTRVLPKLPYSKRIYFFITKGHGRVLSKAETFGRLYSCGFEVVDEKLVGNELYFVARKIKEPVFDNQPTYGPLIRLKRHGKNGHLFNVYKLRTMHAYSEYLQEYVYKHHDLKEGGKFDNDFRVTTEGKFFRKFWVDELPMIINLLKGDMKIVGVRPLSRHYFSLYTDELKEKRTKFKPGLVPPFYADNPKTLEEIMASEMRYLEAFEKSPFTTDVRYFFKAFYNIVFKKARSS